MKQTCILYGDPTGNRVLITNCVTEQFSQEAVLDPSGTDLMYHRFTVVVTGFVTGLDTLVSTEAPLNSVNAGLMNDGVSPNIADPAKQHVSFRSALLEPRKHFEMRAGCTINTSAPTAPQGGTVLLKAAPHPLSDSVLNRRMSPPSPTTFQNTTTPNFGDQSGYDVNNGPRCTRCDVLQIVGNQLFRIRVQFEICKLECDQYGQALNNNQGVVSNRWSVSDDISENFLTTRIFSGQLRVATTQLNAHDFRSWVVPQLQAGFYRKSMSFRVTEDGLTLGYNIVDQETVFSAPGRSTKWLLQHSETNQGNALTVTDVTCQLWADRTVSQQELLRTAFAIVSSKVYPVGLGAPPKGLPETVFYSEMGSDIHSIRIQHRVTRAVPQKNLQGILIASIGNPIDAADPFVAVSPAKGYDPDVSRGARAGDNIELSGPISVANAWRAYLQSPCDEDHEIALAANAEGESESTAIASTVALKPNVSVAVVASLEPTESPWVNPQHQTETYATWDMTSEYVNGANVLMFGIASSAAGGLTPDAPAATFGRLGPDTTQRKVDISGTRIGKEPTMPSIPDTYSLPWFPGASARLLKKTTKSKPPDRTADGTQVFKIAVSLLYGMTHSPKASDPLPIGFNAWEYPSENYKLPPTIYEGPSVGY